MNHVLYMTDAEITMSLSEKNRKSQPNNVRQDCVLRHRLGCYTENHKMQNYWRATGLTKLLAGDCSCCRTLQAGVNFNESTYQTIQPSKITLELSPPQKSSKHTKCRSTTKTKQPNQTPPDTSRLAFRTTSLPSPHRRHTPRPNPPDSAVCSGSARDAREARDPVGVRCPASGFSSPEKRGLRVQRWLA